MAGERRTAEEAHETQHRYALTATAQHVEPALLKLENRLGEGDMNFVLAEHELREFELDSPAADASAQAVGDVQSRLITERRISLTARDMLMIRVGGLAGAIAALKFAEGQKRFPTESSEPAPLAIEVPELGITVISGKIADHIPSSTGE
jgi:hypothetical protein